MACVGNDDDLRAITIGAGGAFAGMKSGRNIRGSYDGLRPGRRANSMPRQPSTASVFVDAPVSGGQAGAENGVLTVMCGGTEDAYTAAEPIIAAYARMCKLLARPARVS